MMDALHPGVVPMKKVDFNARSEYEAIANYKVLQEVLTKLNIDKARARGPARCPARVRAARGGGRRAWHARGRRLRGPTPPPPPPPAPARPQHVEVSKLVKARPLDNMEFMQARGGRRPAGRAAAGGGRGGGGGRSQRWAHLGPRGVVGTAPAERMPSPHHQLPLPTRAPRSG